MISPVFPDQKDTEFNPGYGSAPRAASLSVDLEAAHQKHPEAPTAEVTDETTHSPEEVASLASDNDDSGSQASNKTTHAETDGKGLIAIFLAEDTEFRALCQEAMAKMKRQRFVENLLRPLKSFHKNLTDEAVTEAQEVVAASYGAGKGDFESVSKLLPTFERSRAHSTINRPVTESKI